MSDEMIRVTYRIECPGSVEAMAEKIASDQSTGTFTALPGETDAVRKRCAARVEQITELEQAMLPGFPTEVPGPYNRADVVIAFPIEAIGTDIAGQDVSDMA